MLNPRALKNRRNPSAVESFLKAFDEIGETVLVERDNGLAQTFERWAEQGVDVVAVSGGDGTMHLVVQELVDVWDGGSLPRLLFLHGGGAGIVSRGIGNPDPGDVVNHLRLAREEQLPLSGERFGTLRVDGRIAFSFGMGAFRRICAFYHTYDRPGAIAHLRLAGRFAGSLVVGGGLARSTLDHCLTSIQIGEEEFPPSHFTGLYASSLERLWIAKAYEQIPCSVDGFRVIGLRSMSRVAMLSGAVSFVSGRGMEFFTETLLQETRSLQIRPHHAPLEYMADGEFYATGETLRVESGPQLTVLSI